MYLILALLSFFWFCAIVAHLNKTRKFYKSLSFEHGLLVFFCLLGSSVFPLAWLFVFAIFIMSKFDA